MRLTHLIALAGAAQAAPIIRTIVHTAAPVTQVVTQTTNTVVQVNTVVQTVNSPPPQPTPETTEAAPPTTKAAPTTQAQPVPETTQTPATQDTTTATTPATTTPATTQTTPTTPAAPTTQTTPTTSTASTTETTSATPTTPTTTAATTSATSTATSGPSGDFESDILKAHNDKRALHGVQLLSWDATLAQYAANYAANSFSCDNVQLVHSGGPYGENLAAGLVGGYDPVNAWYDEISQYNYNNPGFSEATGHFTQLVWKDTSKVGCAMVKCNNIWRQYTICEYSDSRGNIVGTDSKTGKSYFAENVLPPLSS